MTDSIESLRARIAELERQKNILLREAGSLSELVGRRNRELTESIRSEKYYREAFHKGQERVAELEDKLEEKDSA